MRKIVLASALVMAGLGFVACDSDDNSGDQNQMIGTWEATDLSYTMPDGNSHTWPFDHPSIKQGCATDYLTLSGNNNASLKENNKEGDDCVDVTITGTWNDETVTINGEEEPRRVIDVTETTLTLEYPYSFMGFETDITVTYTRQ
ncbi:hypothetical protein [Avrilella dinanensis]|uniref:hypothetical protein n=1 Tax=Avrilella dinanensis TaxID=2008672 RepID=UPI00240A695B|nr:hypothetical protein [Avrilella dinanensis]